MGPTICPFCKENISKCECNDVHYDYSDEDSAFGDRDDGNADIEDMKRNHPGHSEEAYRTGRNLGVDFPYVPGDPFW
jgi:hypothetical protein